jgi:hypothetical protein
MKIGHWNSGVRGLRDLILKPRVKLRQNGTVFLMIKLAASMAGPGLNSKQIERRTSVSFSI